MKKLAGVGALVVNVVSCLCKLAEVGACCLSGFC